MRALLIVGLTLSLGFLSTFRAAAQEPPPLAHPYTSAAASGSAASAGSASGSTSASSSASEHKPKRPPVPEGLSEERELPDHDGRGSRPISAGRVLLFPIRVVLFPVYLVSEYVVRQPLGWLVSTAERKKLPTKIVNFFTTDDHKSGIVPTVLIDFGFKPSVGVYAFSDDFLTARNDVRAHFGTWGPRWINVGVTDRVRLEDGSTIAAVASYVHRPDSLFYGLGPRSPAAAKSRYTHGTVDAGGEWTVRLSHNSFFRARAGFRAARFEASGCCGTELEARVAAGELTLPPGFDGYKIAYESALIALDTRARRPASESGFRVEIAAEEGEEPIARGRSWIRWGGIGAAYLDLGRARTISFKTTVRFADPIRGDVPFAEQVILGGDRAMNGYLLGRLTGRSALVGELEYRWPVWVWLDGTMQVALGNVFGPHLEELSTKLLRLSTAIGVRTVGSADHTFQILTGFGTETFEDGLRVSSFRLVFGGTRGF